MITEKLEYFKALRGNKRFRKNQRVWLTLNCANHLYICFKWRGNGRYVRGVIDKFSSIVGEIKTIEVADKFAARILKIGKNG